MKDVIYKSLTTLKNILLAENKRHYLANFRLWLAFEIMPGDVAHLLLIILNKLSDKYEKMDKNTKQKISTLYVDFDFSE